MAMQYGGRPEGEGAIMMYVEAWLLLTCTRSCRSPPCRAAPVGPRSCTPHHPSPSLSGSKTVHTHNHHVSFQIKLKKSSLFKKVISAQ